MGNKDYDVFNDNRAFKRVRRWIEMSNRSFQQKVRMQIKNYNVEQGFIFWKQNYEKEYRLNSDVNNDDSVIMTYYIESTKKLHPFDFDKKLFNKLFEKSIY